MKSKDSFFRKLKRALNYSILGPRGYNYFETKRQVKDIKNRVGEGWELDLLSKIIKPNDFVIDGGSQYSHFSVRLAEMCPEGKVFGFEPSISSFRIANRVIQHFDLPNIVLFQKGLGDKSAMMHFKMPLMSYGATVAKGVHLAWRDSSFAQQAGIYSYKDHKEVKLEVVSIDVFLPTIAKMNFVKLSLEGAELLALRGMKNTIEKYKPLIMLELCLPFMKGFKISDKDVSDFLTDLDYSFYQYNTQKAKLVPTQLPFSDGIYFAIPQNQIENYPNLIE